LIKLSTGRQNRAVAGHPARLLRQRGTLAPPPGFFSMHSDLYFLLLEIPSCACFCTKLRTHPSDRQLGGPPKSAHRDRANMMPVGLFLPPPPHTNTVFRLSFGVSVVFFPGRPSYLWVRTCLSCPRGNLNKSEPV